MHPCPGAPLALTLPAQPVGGPEGRDRSSPPLSAPLCMACRMWDRTSGAEHSVQFGRSARLARHISMPASWQHDGARPGLGNAARIECHIAAAGSSRQNVHESRAPLDKGTGGTRMAARVGPDKRQTRQAGWAQAPQVKLASRVGALVFRHQHVRVSLLTKNSTKNNFSSCTGRAWRQHGKMRACCGACSDTGRKPGPSASTPASAETFPYATLSSSAGLSSARQCPTSQHWRLQRGCPARAGARGRASTKSTLRRTSLPL